MFVCLLILLLLSFYFVGKKKYYVLIESVGDDPNGMEEVLKTQLETTFVDASAIIKRVPGLVHGGTLLNAYLIVKAIREAGGQAKITYHWFWQKPLKGDDPHAEGFREQGYTLFEEGEAERIGDIEGNANLKAFEKIAAAVKIGGDNLYPETMAETKQMDELLDEAEQVARDPEDPEYKRIIHEMRGIVCWSKRRHFNISWFLILGSIVSIGFMKYFNYRENEDRQYTEQNYRAAKAWDLDNDTIPLEKAFGMELYSHDRYKSPNCYRAAKMTECAYGIKNVQAEVNDWTYKYNQATTDAERARCQKFLDMKKEQVKKYEAEREEYRNKSAKELQKEALKYTKGRFKSERKEQYKSLFCYLFFILLIPTYVIANYSYGFKITRHREESRILKKIHEWLMMIGVSLVGAGWILKLLPDQLETVFNPATGRMGTRLTPDPTNFVMIFIKVGLILLGLIIMAVSSSLLMMYSILVGFRRNYLEAQE